MPVHITQEPPDAPCQPVLSAGREGEFQVQELVLMGEELVALSGAGLHLKASLARSLRFLIQPL